VVTLLACIEGEVYGRCKHQVNPPATIELDRGMSVRIMRFLI